MFFFLLRARLILHERNVAFMQRSPPVNNDNNATKIINSLYLTFFPSNLQITKPFRNKTFKGEQAILGIQHIQN